VIRSAIGIKAWLEKTPHVDEVRPTHCGGCGAASRPVGEALAIHGHGLLLRQIRGVLSLQDQPGVVVVSVRRYACQRCRAVMTVVPAGMLARRQYSGPSIAVALYLWLLAGSSDRAVRARLWAWQVRGSNDRGWAQLYRWARQAASVFALPRRVPVLDALYATARHGVLTLRALAPAALSGASTTLQIFEGAAVMR